MNVAKRLLRYFLAAVFLFSGLVKLNDPIGTKIKLEEYFEVFSVDMPALAEFWTALLPYTLIFSIALSSLEVIIASALITQYRIKTSLKITIGLLIFFGFLTFYSAYFNKVTDCGCFGEAIKLSPWTSFTKDMILLLATGILLWLQKNTTQNPSGFWIFGTACLSTIFGILSYLYLPVWDSLPYAVGQNIEKNMKLREPLEFEYVYEIEGKVVTVDAIPADVNAKFISMKAVNEYRAKALITDYRIWEDSTQEDFTAKSFLGTKLFIVIPDFKEAGKSGLTKFWKSIPEITKAYVEPWIITASPVKEIKNSLKLINLNVPILSADAKVLKTMVRSNPGFVLVKNGTVIGKWSGFSPPTTENIIKKFNAE